MRIMLEINEAMLCRIEAFRLVTAADLGINLTRRPAIMMLLKIALDVIDAPGDEPEKGGLQ